MGGASAAGVTEIHIDDADKRREANFVLAKVKVIFEKFKKRHSRLIQEQ